MCESAVLTHLAGSHFSGRARWPMEGNGNAGHQQFLLQATAPRPGNEPPWWTSLHRHSPEELCMLTLRDRLDLKPGLLQRRDNDFLNITLSDTGDTRVSFGLRTLALSALNPPHSSPANRQAPDMLFSSLLTQEEGRQTGDIYPPRPGQLHWICLPPCWTQLWLVGLGF